MKLTIDEKALRIVIEGEVSTDDVESLIKDTFDLVKDSVSKHQQVLIDAHNVEIHDVTFYTWLLSLGKYTLHKGGVRNTLVLGQNQMNGAFSGALTSYFDTEVPS